MSTNHSSQLKVAHLCSYCSEIPFEAMILPKAADLTGLSQGTKPSDSEFLQMNVDKAELRVRLGKFRRILLNEDKCDLCSLLGPILLQQEGTLGFNRINGLSVDGEELECDAKVTYYTRVLLPIQESHQYAMNRLSVMFKIQDTYGFGSYDCFQACADPSNDFAEVSGLLPSNEVHTDMQLFGGRSRPAQLNVQWIARWMSICDEEHGTKCLPAQISTRSGMPTLRFVDVVRDCVAVFHDAAPEDFRYVALSYVWGKSRQAFDVRTTNVNELTTPGSLSGAPISRTIADTVSLTKQLGITYLWVDALSVLQDSNEDKAIQINAMSRIYRSSSLTVVCAAGSHADVGLPGLHPGTRLPEQPRLRVPLRKGSAHPEIKEDSMVIMPTLNPTKTPLGHQLSSTAWMTRAWTLQERLLSRRVLTFARNQVLWSCMERSFCEESYCEHEFKCERFSTSANDMMLPFSFQSRVGISNNVLLWESLRNLVVSYSARDMTHHGDVYNAFVGVQQALTDITGERFLYGMPCSRFEIALSWKNNKAIQRRATQSSLPMTDQNIHIYFPSWSWMGWEGEVWMSVDHDTQEFGFAPSMRCFVHRRSPDLQFPLVSAAEGEEFLDLGIGDEIDLSVVTASYPQLNLDRLDSIPSETILFFHTHTARFYVAYSTEPVRPGFDGLTTNIKPRIFCDCESAQQIEQVTEGASSLVVGTLESTMDGYKSGYFTFAVIGKVSDPDAQFVNEVVVVLQLGNWPDDDEYARLGIVRRLNIGTIDEADFWQQVSREGKSRWDDETLIVLG